MQKFPNLRQAITKTLLQTFSQIKAGKVFRGALWIIGEYCTEVEGEHSREHDTDLSILRGGIEIHEAMQEIRKTIGEIPILASEQVSLLSFSIGDIC